MAVVAFLGNFSKPATTETHLAASWEAEGHEVIRLQEGIVTPADVIGAVHAHQADLVLWVQTMGLAEQGGTNDERMRMLARLRAREIPTVAFHLDRWWGLDREPSIFTEAFFRCDIVITADGGHDEQWAAAGVNHRWLPPAVYHAEAEHLGVRRTRMLGAVGFVGSWDVRDVDGVQQGYHSEWRHRGDLIRFLHRTYGRRLRLWPPRRSRGIRGAELADLYASTTVMVGDSCLVPRPDGTPMISYSSDRIPEAAGRGGFLVHPWVEGITDGTQYEPDVHLATWPLGDWDALKAQIDRGLADGPWNASVRAAGRAHVLEHHTYRVRVRQVLALMAEAGLLPEVPA